MVRVRSTVVYHTTTQLVASRARYLHSATQCCKHIHVHAGLICRCCQGKAVLLHLSCAFVCSLT